MADAALACGTPGQLSWMVRSGGATLEISLVVPSEPRIVKALGFAGITMVSPTQSQIIVYPPKNLMTVSFLGMMKLVDDVANLNRKSPRIPRQQRMCVLDGKGYGKRLISITAKSFNHADLRELLMIEWFGAWRRARSTESNRLALTGGRPGPWGL
ncbi:hypothetical protein D8I35_10920 [Corticibacter populi]|uniref:Uncharacterized protein n=2 Tax=Corticibacter populi TaxID=1550736 RepID=A0A3M6QT04_9BURK|nr:hypothetical protein [Corticibacter populi]RMX05689.1 hypothetical protein D8I35_10920 [Corticibacter populi]